MRIAGLQKLTLVDFPGLIAATVFTQGCNFRCGYCHNRELVLPQFFQETLPTEAVLDYLNSRRGKLEGVVITGGEPTIQVGLADFIARIKEMDFAVKLDTNGSRPEVLSSLIELKLVDYLAMDIKSSLKKYAQVTGTACHTVKLKESIKLIINSGIPYQFRTTLVKEFCSDEDLGDIQPLIAQADQYLLQPFVPSEKMIDAQVKEHPQYAPAEVDVLKAKYDLIKKLRVL